MVKPLKANGANNVVTTLLTSKQRCYNVKTTSCAHWDVLLVIIMLIMLIIMSVALKTMYPFFLNVTFVRD